MLKSGQITRFQVNLATCSGYPQPPTMFFLIDCISKNGSFVMERDLTMSENINFLLLFLQLFIG